MQALTTELSIQLHLEIVLAHKSLSVATVCSSNNKATAIVKQEQIVTVTITVGYERDMHRDVWTGVA